MWVITIVFILLAMYALLMGWYTNSWLQMPLTHPPAEAGGTTRVSVIVPARNEGDNIEACLMGILSQQYPATLTQVIVIDDASTDGTGALVEALGEKFPNLICLSLPPHTHFSHKKRAIEAGIKAATGQLIVCTDADCAHPPGWLSHLVQQYEREGSQFIAAPVMYHTANNLLSVFQTLDFLSLQGITGASVFKRFHTMCNGANIAYPKAAFEAVNGFAGIDALPTGDDMLLMHKIYKAHPHNVTWLKSRDAIVSTQPAESWRAFFQQRIRWASKAAFFDDRRIFYVLLLVYLLNVGLLVLGLASFFSLAVFKAFLLAIAIKTGVELSFMIPVARFFNKQQWLWYFPLMQPLHIIYTVTAGWLGRFGSYEWKGRIITPK